MKTDLDRPLAGRRIAVPETRELNLLAEMLEAKGANVLRCPLVAIHDAPDPAPVLAWIDALVAGAFNDVVFYTGEGIRRLVGFVDRHGRREEFLNALRGVRKITRGPKPVRALHEIGLDADVRASAPTTAGIIETLRALEFPKRSIGVVFYGPEFNEELLAYLRTAGLVVHGVAPYVYASKIEDEAVGVLLDELSAGRIDLIAFTSQSQVDRLAEFVKSRVESPTLGQILGHTRVAAVGPVVAATLESLGVPVAIVPEKSFFMRPMVNEMVRALSATENCE